MASTLLASHLDQISLCAASISDLEFPGPKQFTNALLGRHEITALIRDTELHERALFSVAPPTLSSKGDTNLFSGSNISNPPRHSIAPHASRAPKRSAAVAAVLGRDLFRKIRESDTTATRHGHYGEHSRGKGELDVDMLLEGATKLCQVYPVPGAADEIRRLKARYEQLRANIAHYEDKVARNSTQLDDLSKWGNQGGARADENMDTPESTESIMTREDLEREEREINDLERKKKGLESRVSEMDKDLGGLMR